jgi:predicted flap endonuclease-1-like 5' DNA nuclease
MAKKIQSSAKKNLKRDSSKNESLVEEINAKLKSRQKELQTQVDELKSQVKTLGKKPSKTARKLFKSIEKSYHDKVQLMQNDFDKRLESVQKLQDKVIAQLPKELAAKLSNKHNSPAKDAKAPRSAATKASNSIAVASVLKSPKPKSLAKAVKVLSLTSINGIGPVMQKKLLAAGFAKLEDLANTPVNKAAALKQFEKSRGYGNWKKEAQALLNKK